MNITSINITPELLCEMFRKDRLGDDFEDLQEITDKWGYLRQIYIEHYPSIMEVAKNSLCAWADVYFVNWMHYFSKAERECWHAIRARPMCLYPQFPLFNYFIDFAHPAIRIGLEIDGRQYHDPKKDRVKDEKFLRYGWRIYRVPASKCFTQVMEWGELRNSEMDYEDYEMELKKHFFDSINGVVHALQIVYFSTPNEQARYQQDCDNIWELALQTLEIHRGANFQVLSG